MISHEVPRQLLISQTQAARRDLMAGLESGERDYKKLDELYERYKNFQSAADKLGDIVTMRIA